MCDLADFGDKLTIVAQSHHVQSEEETAELWAADKKA